MKDIVDTLNKLGQLALATRLKRLSEKLSKDVSLVYKKMGLDFKARWFPLFYSIKIHAPISVVELAHQLGISHTAVNQLATELIKKGYVQSTKLKRDERLRLFELTEKGRNIYKSLTPLLEKIAIANDSLVNISNPNFISGLETIEKALDEKSMFDRIWFLANGSLPGEVVIHEYSSKMKKHFKRLNYEWLEEYFTVEEKDQAILNNPNSKIIKNGGVILFAEFEKEIVGTCALIKHSNNIIELAKMAVAKKFRGRRIGEKLLVAAVDRAKQMGVDKLFLLTNKKLIAANHLYVKNGFQKIPDKILDNKGYSRNTYTMVLNLVK